MSKIIVALDGMTWSKSLHMAMQLKECVWGFKLNDLLLEYGVSAVREFKKVGPVMADPKLHDIPNTVGNGVRRLHAAGADLITVHASGGLDMLTNAVALAGEAKILAVTVLTSLNDHGCEYSYGGNVRNTVRRFMDLANRAGVAGVVCSPQEEDLAAEVPNLIKVVPGIRLPDQRVDDQARTGLPKWANYVVVGRPITQAADPIAAAHEINKALEAA